MNPSELIVILGASDNPQRPSFMADKILRTRGYQTLPIDTRHPGELSKDFAVQGDKTVAIFVKPAQQRKYYDYLLSLNPTRIIFNPGTENEELKQLADRKQIKVLNGCTISMFLNSLF